MKIINKYVICTTGLDKMLYENHIDALTEARELATKRNMSFVIYKAVTCVRPMQAQTEVITIDE